LLKGIYTAASGMVAEMTRAEVLANNLANVNTNGYKGDLAVNKSFGDLLLSKIEQGDANQLVGGVGSGVFVDQIAPVFLPGSYRDTGNNLDVALEGEGFFTLQTPQGERYTRDGAFSLNSEGYLVTREGYLVLGENGPLQVKDLDKLRIMDFPDKTVLQKEGNNIWSATGPGQDLGDAARVRQGTLEGSNVNIISEMVNLIAAARAYELSQKMIQTQDASLDKAVNEVGRAG